jgi:ubiquinone/menaquinone biosynthesis C-methylase UbiE
LPENSLEIFNDWILYNKILEKDYMFHSEIFSKIQKIISSKFGEKSYKLLDMGCGDAYCIEKFLTNTGLNYYCGVDKSDKALFLAEKNMSKDNIKTLLLNSDFTESLDKINDDFDVVLAGYSIHHLESLEEKTTLLHKSIEKLQNDGIFVFYDLIQKDDESLEQYHERYIKNCKDNWKSIGVKELDQISNHIKKNDYPLTLQGWKNIFESSPVNLEPIIIEDKNPYYVLLCFQKKH